MKHEVRCIEFPCTCVTILRDKIKSLEKKIEDSLSCCCSQCARHNQILANQIEIGKDMLICENKNDTL